MSYRVETASSGRAVCRATECKKRGIKIDKDDLRLGVWVENDHYQSWSWKHWGCVTGKQLQNMRAYLEIDGQPGTYDFDRLDGYDSPGEKNSLNHHPDLQEKVRNAIIQGRIDPEDFNGDEEMNVLGATGLHSAATKKKQRKEEIEDLTAKVAKLEAEKNGGVKTEAKSAKKGKRVKAEVDSDEEEQKPVKKKRAGKVKKEEEDDQEEVATKPARKSRAKKTVKNEEDDEMDELAEQTFTSMTVAQLKVILKERDLPVSGNKAALIERLEESSLPTPPKKESVRGEVKQEHDDEPSFEAPARRVKKEPSEMVADMAHLPDNVQALAISEVSPNSAVAEHGSSDQQEAKLEESDQVATALNAPTGGRRRSARRAASGVTAD